MALLERISWDDLRVFVVVARTLSFCGFRGVRYLKGGLAAWSEAGGELVETTASGVERPLPRYQESPVRRAAYQLACAITPRLLLIAFGGAGLLLAGVMLFIR